MFDRFREEEGMAMVVALLVSFAVLLLSTVVVAQSIHSTRGSGYDRERLQSVNAAEAGTNYYYTYLQTHAPGHTGWSCSSVTQTVNSSPATSSFTATASYYDSSGNAMTCSGLTSKHLPNYVVINSVGKAANEATRNFQTYMKLTPVYGGFTGAILSNSSVDFGNNFNTYGNSGNNADVYVLTGNYIQDNNSAVRGNVYVPNGSASMSNSSQILGNLYSLNSASLTSVTGNVTSTTSTISGGTVGGNATAGGAITSTVTGTKLQNQSGLANPPTQSYPLIGFTASDWTAEGYTINTYSGANACTNARNFVEGSWTGDYVVRITGPLSCTYSNSNNSTVTLNGNLAIISDWSIDISQASDWNGATSLRNLYFISTYDSSVTCASGVKAVSTGNNTNFNSLVQVLFYSPCTTTLANQNAFSGQALGSTINITNQFNMTYQPVYVPGINGITGFTQDISYVREVA